MTGQQNLPGEGLTVEALLDEADRALSDLNTVIEAVRAALRIDETATIKEQAQQ